MNSYDFLKFLTVNLQAKKEITNNLCTATGFYLILKGKPVIVTAKHFAKDAQELLTVPVHYKENDTIITLSVTTNVEWIYSDEYDIAYCSIKPIADRLKKITGKDMFYTAITEKDIIRNDELDDIKILSEVLTMGYPYGESSTHHQFPLFKKGYISSSPGDFEEDCVGYLELTGEKGCSGSPVLLNNHQLKLVGILVKYIGSNTDSQKNTTIYITADKILDIK